MNGALLEKLPRDGLTGKKSTRPVPTRCRPRPTAAIRAGHHHVGGDHERHRDGDVILELKDITKAYSGIVALKKADLKLGAER